MKKKTPLYERHLKYNAKMVEFGDWLMPVYYSSIKEEHLAVRKSVGMFDVSHMGEFIVVGPDAERFIGYIVTNRSDIEPKNAFYTVMCNENGGIIDDLIVYRLSQDRFLMVVNANNIEKDFNWIRSHTGSFRVSLKNESDNFALIALQGPLAQTTLMKITANETLDLKRFGVDRFRVLDQEVLIARTGYTGEDGFEIFIDPSYADQIWEALLNAGEEAGIKPCGLGARDSLRLEMGYCLYGNDITEDTNPYEARLGWTVKLDKGDFIGKNALEKIKRAGVERKLWGFILENRSIPRHGFLIKDKDGNEIGEVTSGSFSPVLNKPIGMGYLKKEFAEDNKTIFIDIRKRTFEAKTKKPPFLNK